MEFKEVERCTDFLINLTSVYRVKEDGMVINENDDPVEISVNGEKKVLYSLRQNLPGKDIAIINPFSESISEKSANKALYAGLVVGLYLRFSMFLDWLYSQKGLDMSDDLDLASAKVVSSLCKKVDSDMVKRVSKLNTHFLDFMNIYFNRRTKKVVFRCALFEDDEFRQKVKFPKTKWNNLRHIMAKLLGINLKNASEDLAKKYSFKSDLLTCPKLHGTMVVLCSILESMAEYDEKFIKDNPRFDVDMEEFRKHINNLNEYYDATKWLVQPSAKKETSTPMKEKVPSASRVPNVVSGPVFGSQVKSSSVPDVITPLSSFAGGTSIPVHRTPVTEQRIPVRTHQSIPNPTVGSSILGNTHSTPILGDSVGRTSILQDDMTMFNRPRPKRILF